MPPHPLDVICAVLRCRLNGDALGSTVLAALERGGIDDRRLVAVASSHRVTPGLAACLGDLGLDERLPPQLRDYLAFMRASNAARNRRLREELETIVRRLNSLGVEPCLLKGAARLVDGLYPDHSWRFMIDLDLLVPEERLSDCVGALRGDGYEPRYQDNAEAQHYPALVGTGKCAPIELHRRLAQAPYVSLLPAHEAIERSVPERCGGGRVRLPALEEQIVHLIAHCQLFHHFRFFGLVRLSDAVELDLLTKRAVPDFDWARIINRFARRDWRRACLSFLHATGALLGTCIPVESKLDVVTKLQVVRMLGQQRRRSAMIIGMTLGWASYGLHRLKHRRDKARFLARLATDPRSYLRKLDDALAEFGPRSS